MELLRIHLLTLLDCCVTAILPAARQNGQLPLIVESSNLSSLAGTYVAVLMKHGAAKAVASDLSERFVFHQCNALAHASA